MKRSVWGWIVAGVAAVGAAAVVAYEELKGKSPGGGGQPTQQLTPGHRYALTLSCPGAASIPVPALASLQTAWAQGTLLVALTPVVVQSVSTTGDGPANQAGVKLVQSITVVFDYNGAAMTLPQIKAGNGTACSSSLVDQGPTPTSVQWGPHGGGHSGGGHTFNPPQQVSLQNGQTAKAYNVSGGAIIVTTPGTITGANGAPVKSWSSANGNSNQATIVLSGNAGTISVTWDNGQPQGATIQVS